MDVNKYRIYQDKKLIKLFLNNNKIAEFEKGNFIKSRVYFYEDKYYLYLLGNIRNKVEVRCFELNESELTEIFDYKNSELFISIYDNYYSKVIDHVRLIEKNKIIPCYSIDNEKFFIIKHSRSKSLYELIKFKASYNGEKLYSINTKKIYIIKPAYDKLNKPTIGDFIISEYSKSGELIRNFLHCLTLFNNKILKKYIKEPEEFYEFLSLYINNGEYQRYLNLKYLKNNI